MSSIPNYLNSVSNIWITCRGRSAFIEGYLPIFHEIRGEWDHNLFRFNVHMRAVGDKMSFNNPHTKNVQSEEIVARS
jgi:hypothetical protein